MSDDHINWTFNEDLEPYSSPQKKRDELKFYASQEEMDEDRYRELAKYPGIENLINLRQLINISYGMHGYDPNKPTGPHIITFPTPEQQNRS